MRKSKRLAWLRLVLCTLWAALPPLMLFLLVLQPLVLSRSRLALTLLLIPILAWMMYRTVPAWSSHVSRRDWVALAVVSGVVAMLAAVPLSQAESKSFVFAPRHTLRIDTLQLSAGQTIELKWFHTSLGDVSLNALAGAGGWKRTGDTLSLTSKAVGSLMWLGWTGEQATLAFTASPGAIIKAGWDGHSRTIDFAQTGGRAQVEDSFVRPWWGFVGLALTLFGALLFVAVLVLLNSRIRVPDAYLPAWAGWWLILGLVCGLMVSVWSVPADDLQLPLVLSLSALLAAPLCVLAEKIRERRLLDRLLPRLVQIVQRHSLLLTCIGSLGIGLGIFGGSIWTNWAVFDDHELMLFVGPDRSLSLVQMLRDLPATEIGQFGLSPRFRPTYWFLRLLECAVWGAHPFYWHALRVAVLVIALALFWRLVSPILGWLGGGLLCAYALTFPYWREIVGWLGPGESYGVAGLPLYIWGALSLLRTRDPKGSPRRLVAGLALVAGSLLCIGSKESFVLLAVPSLYVAYRGLRTRDAVAVGAGAASILFAAYVGTSILLAVSTQGVDVYSHSVAPSERLSHILSALQGPEAQAQAAVLLGLTGGLCATLLIGRWTREARQTILVAFLWMAGLCVIYASQLVFYNGDWPNGTRYDYPGLLYIPAGLLILFDMGVRLMSLDEQSSAIVSLRGATALALGLLILVRGYGPITQFIAENVRSTNSFVGRIERISSVLRSHPDHALVIESGDPADYEAVYSYERFLRAYGANNTLFLRLNGYSPETAIYTQERQLVADMNETSVNGLTGPDPLTQLNPLPGTNEPGFAPLRELAQYSGRCYSVRLSGSFPSGCTPIE